MPLRYASISASGRGRLPACVVRIRSVRVVMVRSSRGSAWPCSLLLLAGAREREDVLLSGALHALLVILLPDLRPRAAEHVQELVLERVAGRHGCRDTFD